MVLAHMAKHTRRDNFSCGLCGKGSNWQSVIRVLNQKNTLCPSAEQSGKFEFFKNSLVEIEFQIVYLLWWLVSYSPSNNDVIITHTRIRDHNRESVLEHIRSAHYNNNQQETNGSLTGSSKLMMLSGGQVVNGSSPSRDQIELPPPASTTVTSSPAAFRCGVCHQVSNWKHVIQVSFS